MDIAMIGKTLGHYRILEKIGAGGMGEVYHARDEQLGRDVALKVLPPGALSDPAARTRLRDEARTASSLNNPHICTIYEVGEANGQMYIAMEYVAGSPLSALIPDQGLPVENVIRYGAQIADALAHAHDQGIIHRDLKSANVVITPDGRAKVLDFGLAGRLSEQDLSEATKSHVSLEQSGKIAGTLLYMAPEALRGDTTDSRSDLWASGVVLYEMAAGKLPFKGQTGFELSSAILNAAPTPLPPGIAAGLRAVVQRCLAKEPGQRYQRASEIRAALEAIGTDTAGAAAPPRRVVSRRAALVVAGVLAALLALLAWSNLGGLRNSLLGRVGPPRIESLAVLPLENLSRDPEQEYFADGMTEALTTELSRISALKVISRTSAMQFKGVKKPAPEIARALAVDALIEGSVVREGDQVRITVQLIRGATDQHLWAESYQRQLQSILMLQGEIARAIASEIKVKVTPQQEARFTTARVVDPQAHEAYLRGRYYWNKSTEEGGKKAMGYFNQAIEKDPAYAPAYAGLAWSYALLGDFQVLPPKEVFPKAEAAASRALELDEALAEAHTALAIVRLEYGWDWAATERECKRAIELDPSDPTAHQAYSWYLGAVLRYEESLAEGKRALELDPLSIFRNADWGLSLYYLRHYDQAIEQSKKTLEMDPRLDYAHWAFGLAAVQKRNYDEAVAHLREAVTYSGESPRYVAALGYAYGRAGRRSEARKILDKLNGLSKQKYISPYLIATIYAGLGENEDAFAWLEKAYQEHDNWLAYIQFPPEFDPLRSDPRFQNLLRRMNFPP